MKKITIILITFFITVGLMIVLNSCSDKEKEDYSEEGRAASVEFCKCIEEREDDTGDECFDALTDKYEYSKYTSDTFINAFNKTNTCGVELHITKIDAALNPHISQILIGQ